MFGYSFQIRSGALSASGSDMAAPLVARVLGVSDADRLHTMALSCGSSEHTVSSSLCPIWKKENVICEVKAKSGVSYPEARRQVMAMLDTPTPGESYALAQAAKVLERYFRSS